MGASDGPFEVCCFCCDRAADSHLTCSQTLTIVFVAMLLFGPAWLIIWYPPIGAYIGITIYLLYACCFVIMLIGSQPGEQSQEQVQFFGAVLLFGPGCLIVWFPPIGVYIGGAIYGLYLCCFLIMLIGSQCRSSTPLAFSSFEKPVEKHGKPIVVFCFYNARVRGNGDLSMGNSVQALQRLYRDGLETFELELNDDHTARRHPTRARPISDSLVDAADFMMPHGWAWAVYAWAV